MLLAATSLLFTPSVQAQAQPSPHGYVFAGIGTSELQANCQGTVRCDRRDRLVQLGGGAWLPVTLFEGRFALEARWAEFGSTELANATLNAKIGNEAIMAGVAWHRPLAHGLGVTASVGVARVSTTLELQPGGGGSVNSRDSHTQGYGALGLNASLGSGFTVGLEGLLTRMRYDRAGFSLGSGRLSGVSMTLTKHF